MSEAFARHGIPLSEHRAGEQGDPLLSTFSPANGPEQCLEGLAVSLFKGSDEVDKQIARSGFSPGNSRYVTKSEDGQQVVGLVRENVLVALTKSDCFSEARVRKALGAVGT